MILLRKCSVALLSLVLVAGCASGPTVRSNVDSTVDFTTFRTYGFVSETGTDRAGYSTLTTTQFKSAIRNEMESRGYRYLETAPDLLINFSARVQEKTDVVSRPVPSYGYYGYRYGMYSAWPMYQTEVDTVHYKVGTANIDVVDAAARQLVWEGVAEGRLGKKALENPEATIHSVVAEIFKQFPVQPPAEGG